MYKFVEVQMCFKIFEIVKFKVESHYRHSRKIVHNQTQKQNALLPLENLSVIIKAVFEEQGLPAATTLLSPDLTSLDKHGNC